MRSLLSMLPVLSAVMLAALLVRLFTTGLSWIGVVALLICIGWFGLDTTRALLRWRERKRHVRHLAALEKLDSGPRGASTDASPPSAAKPDDSGSAPILSLVYFLAEPRQADEESIRRVVSNALEVRFQPPEIDSSHLVVGLDPPEEGDGFRHFFVILPIGTFAVLLSPGPYIEDPGAFAHSSIRDKRLRSAIEEHRAWISVDYVEETSRATKEQLYAVIGKVMAALAGPDCLALYCPELQRCNEFDPALIEVLAGGRPLELFDEPTFEPIIEIADNDPRMAAAVKKARKRWSEFEKAFAAREDLKSQLYLVKAEFREGDRCEFMWVSVSEIKGGKIRGVLMNDPHELLDLHRGADVSFDLDRLNDWIYPTTGGTHAGGFTLDVLAEEDES